ncbi:MAG: type I restriction endonuclease subunit R [Nanoarchaeota archaeon]
MSKLITESEVEELALKILKDLGYSIINGPDISPDGNNEERTYQDVILVNRLRESINKLNPNIPKEAREEAIKKVIRTESQNLTANNQHFHNMLVNGVNVEYRKGERIINDIVWLFDFKNIKNNEFLAINQFTIIEEHNNRRPDILLFINGIPLVIIELKNIADEEATIWSAFNQIKTYQTQIPSLFRFNEICIISDGFEARAGTITSDKERFMPWKTIEGEEPKKLSQLETLLKGMFNKNIILDLIRHFIVFEQKEEEISKKLAAYHQYNAVNKALETTIKATKSDKRAGVVWHTQGSGKSLTMVFYTGKLVLTLDNPTIILLTDRNDLDDQLHGTFSRCNSLLRQKPVQADNRAKLRELLKVASGGIVFTTIQKFLPEEKGDKFPLLSERKNIVVIADEAHRSQYDFIDGFAKHMRDALPNASFIGFTGTPIEKADRNTRAVFGNDIDVYDIQKAVEDENTVRIYYEGRLAKLELKPEERPKIDPSFEEVTEKEEAEHKEKLKSKWARLEAVVGSEKRIRRIAKDIIKHFEERINTLEGKGMIVCMSRRICVDLHNELIKLKPEWHHKEDDKGFLKVIMTGSASDKPEWQEHIRNKLRRRKIGEDFKDPSKPIKLVIVRDMWLTGFDAPSLHTMYVDKPMRGHGLMQAIARVNRVFKDKKGGLIVDYIGIAYDLKKALAEYTESGGKGKPTFNQEDAVDLMLEQYEIVKGLFHGYNYKKFLAMSTKERLDNIKEPMDFVLKNEEGKERYLKYVKKLLESFALSVPHEKALKIRDEVGFFQLIKSVIIKTTTPAGKEQDNLDSAIKQIISKAIISDRVIDIFAAAGLKKPDISILSDEFLAEVKEMPQKNLAFEMLKKLLTDEIRIRQKKNLVKGRLFSEMLDKAIKMYINKSIETAQVIEELMELARRIRDDEKSGQKLKLTNDEVAFYDALVDHNGVREVLGDEKLAVIARELLETIRRNVTIDWTMRENVQAKMRVMIKKLLNKYGYPPDKQKKATDLVLEQANLICKDWAETNGHHKGSFDQYIMKEPKNVYAVADKPKEYKK